MNSAQRRKARRAQERAAKAQPAPTIELRQAVSEIQQRLTVLALPAPRPMISVSEWEAFSPVRIGGVLTFPAMANRSSAGYVYDRKPAYQMAVA